MLYAKEKIKKTSMIGISWSPQTYYRATESTTTRDQILPVRRGLQKGPKDGGAAQQDRQWQSLLKIEDNDIEAEQMSRSQKVVQTPMAQKGCLVDCVRGAKFEKKRQTNCGAGRRSQTPVSWFLQ
jgi:hypothetical protein